MHNYARISARYIPRPVPSLQIRSLLSLSQSPCHTRLPNSRSFAQLSQRIAGKPRIKYDWIRGVEELADYEPGGYHPLIVGETLQGGRYNIVDKLGHGGYSMVWLTYDNLLKRYLALKVNIASSVSRETQVLRALSAPLCNTPGCRFIPELLDEFKVQGPNGIYTCYTVPLAAVARVICYNLTQAIAYVHSQGYVHGDIHLNNVLLTPLSNFDNLSVDQFYKKYGNPQIIPVTQRNGSKSPLPPNIPAQVARSLLLGRYIDQIEVSKTQILLNDFGEAFNPALEVRLGKDCHTSQCSRAPEAKFEADTHLTDRSDIWSLATALWEIIGMKPIFSNEFVPEDEDVAQHIDILGPMPSDWWGKWEARN
ncbi:uncharacterized protein N7483_002920 [Penicillium malachiteum]|uniref:uncharacterized protein n=1 Tax=Penicillium malachiteum TaxID=1324776 RepID=UPI002549926A|nr:uncharacterized protein N7483_002920 [Penicillium malachiteum]KAJ5737795.1 hypothetical protein N7483_002920 [Penicillium malachiteum]